MFRFAATLILVAGLAPVAAHSDDGDPAGAVILVATPRLIDPDYRASVLLAAPIDGHRHIGIIINRPTGRSLASLFPEHGPSKLVRDPVYFGGPMLRQALFAVVRASHTPGAGSVRMTKDLFLALRGAVVDHIIEETPNKARYYVGYVVWRPYELRQEIDHGLWYVLDPDSSLVFTKDPGKLWEELLRRARAVTASVSFS